MSDRSSESSCEWVLLNEKNDTSLENAGTQPINLEINYDSVCLAAAESIRSSFSGEELEWEYDRLETDSDLPPYDFSHIDDFDCDQVNMEYAQNVSRIEDLDISNCISNYEEEIDVDIASISKTRCYRHNRNDRLNFILDIMLALATTLVFGMGTGHFLAWYHKCQFDLPQARFGADRAVMSNDEIIKQTVQTYIPKESDAPNKISISKNLLDSFSLDSKDESNSVHQRACKELSSTNLDTGSIIPEASILINDFVPLSANNETAQSNFSDSEFSLSPNIFSQVEWNGIPNIAVSVKDINEHLSDLEEASIVDFEHIIKVTQSNVPEGNFEESSIKNKDSFKENSLTSQLGKDLNKIIQTLGTVVQYKVSDADKKYSSRDLKLINFYSDFQKIINSKLSFIDDLIESVEYKNYKKFGTKHLQRMVYSLVDSVDYLMKMSMKTLRSHRKLDTYKFAKRISKVIFNLDKKWEKNQRIWYENIEKIKSREFRDRSFKREDRNWKKKAQFEKDSNKKYERYSMKS